VPSKKSLEETVHVRFAQEVKLLGHRDRPTGNDASRSQECIDKTAVQSASRPEEPSSSPRGHRLDSPVQRSDLQAVDRQPARSHWQQSHHEEQRLELGNHSDRLLLHTVVQGVGPEEPGPSWAWLPRTSQQVERHSVQRDHPSLHICGSSPWRHQVAVSDTARRMHALATQSSASKHGLTTGKTSSRRNMMPHKWRRGDWWRGITGWSPLWIPIMPLEHHLHHHQPTPS